MRYLKHAIIVMTAFTLATAGAMADDPKTDVPKSDAPKIDIPKTDDPKADELKGCDDRTPDISIASCTSLIDAPETSPDVRSRAFFLRGVGYAHLGRFHRAIRDYDEAIQLNPQHTMALNNRADAWLRLGEPAQGLPDIDRALSISPRHPLFNTTRGELAQSIGDREGAIRNYETAMAQGGAPFIKFFQCGLRLQRLYHGPLDGVLRPDFRTALNTCVEKGSQCDPALPFLTSECPELVG
jgi:tetratricopeptide (TPR) repeat protein